MRVPGSTDPNPAREARPGEAARAPSRAGPEAADRSDLGTLGEGLLALGRRVAGEAGATPPTLLSARTDGPVLRVGELVLKAHPEDSDPVALRARLAVASSPALADVLLPPVAHPGFPARVGTRLVTAWPAGLPVDPDEPEAAPWSSAARLLARLHAANLAGLEARIRLPPAGAPRRVARAMERLRALPPSPEAEAVEAAYKALPGWAKESAETAPGRPVTLAHGDFHLGQLVRVGAEGNAGWRLIDIDDLGRGDPAWDLARPAAWFAMGLLSPETWRGFLEVYLASGGRAIPEPGDVWGALELPARALTIQAAALALCSARAGHRALDEVEASWVDACRRMPAK